MDRDRTWTILSESDKNGDVLLLETEGAGRFLRGGGLKLNQEEGEILCMALVRLKMVLWAARHQGGL
jgi:hypothetical protein